MLNDNDNWFDYIKENPHLPWNYGWLSENPNITWEHVKNNPDCPWDYYYLSKIQILLGTL